MSFGGGVFCLSCSHVAAQQARFLLGQGEYFVTGHLRHQNYTKAKVETALNTALYWEAASNRHGGESAHGCGNPVDTQRGGGRNVYEGEQLISQQTYTATHGISP